MSLECRNNRLQVSSHTLLDSFGNEIFINMGNIRDTIILDEEETNTFINELGYHSELGKINIKKLRNILKSEGFTLELNPTLYNSHYDGLHQRITIGVKNHKNPDAVRYLREANLNESISEKFIIGTMFVHECCHHIFNKCLNNDSGEIRRVGNMINNYINTSGKSLTKLGSNGCYTNTNIIKEDITELIRMYITHPNILKDHLKFLSTTGSISVLNSYNLYRISEQDAQTIYNLISKVVDNYLQ